MKLKKRNVWYFSMQRHCKQSHQRAVAKGMKVIPFNSPSHLVASLRHKLETKKGNWKKKRSIVLDAIYEDESE